MHSKNTNELPRVNLKAEAFLSLSICLRNLVASFMLKVLMA